MSDTISGLASKLRSYWLRDMGAGGGVAITGGGGMTAHALSGAYHTGTLAEAQAPWAVTDTEFGAHTSNPDAHHARQHGILASADHTVTGSQWQIVGLTAANTLGLLTPASAPGQNVAAILRTDSAGRVSPYALGVESGYIHSNSSFRFVNVDGSAWQVVAIGSLVNQNGNYYTTARHLFSDSAGPLNGVSANNFMASNDSGHSSRVPLNGIYSLGVIRADGGVQTPLLTTFAGGLTIQSASGNVLFPASVTLRSSDWTPGVLGTGWGLQDRAGQPGRSHLDIRSIYVDELIATTFTADQVRVRSGSDWLGEALAIAARDNSDLKATIPAVGSSARIYVENAPEVTGRIFDENEYVLIKTINRGTGLVIRETWGQVSGYIAESGARQSYLWTTRSGGGNFTLEPGTALTGFGVSSGSYIFRTVVEAGRGPYERFATWSGNPYTPANRVSRVEVGDIRNAIGDASTRYGIAGGNNLALTPATGFSGFSADNLYGFRLYNASQYLHSSGVLVSTLTPGDGLNFLAYNSLTPPDQVRQVGWWASLTSLTTPIASMFGANYLSGSNANDRFVLGVKRPGQWSNAIQLTAYNESYATQAELLLQAWDSASGLPSYAHIQAQDITFSTTPKVGTPGTGSPVWHTGNFNPGAYGALAAANTWTATQTFATLQFATGITNSGYLYSSTPVISFHNSSSGALVKAGTGGLYASNDSGHVSRVPANGIYSLGAVAIGVAALAAGVMLDVGGQTYMRAALTLDGAIYLAALAAAPSVAAGYLPVYFDNATQTLRARLPGGQIKVITWANA